MWKFFAGALIGFILGTTYPQETRYFVNLTVTKALNILKDIKNSLDKSTKQNNNEEENYPIFDN